jgi:hypothetical protein
MTRCKNGTRKNKSGICLPNKSPKKRSATRRNEEWNSDVEKEFNNILKQLREGKLKQNQFSSSLNRKSCLSKFTIDELQSEIDSRKKQQERPVNILIPRKKIKT